MAREEYTLQGKPTAPSCLSAYKLEAWKAESTTLYRCIRGEKTGGYRDNNWNELETLRGGESLTRIHGVIFREVTVKRGGRLSSKRGMIINGPLEGAKILSERSDRRERLVQLRRDPHNGTRAMTSFRQSDLRQSYPGLRIWGKGFGKGTSKEGTKVSYKQVPDRAIT